MASGRFERAFQQYGQAGAVDGASAAPILARLRLAGAMLGRDVGASLTSPVSVGDSIVEIEDFEAVVAAMRLRNGEGQNGAAATDYCKDAPRPTQWKVSRFTGELPGNAASSAAAQAESAAKRAVRQPAADELAALAADGVLYIASGSGVAACSLSNGQRRWNTSSSPGSGPRSARARIYRARPLVVGQRLIVRQETEAGMSLHGFDAASGDVVWKNEFGEQARIVSDAVTVDGQVVLVAASQSGGQQGLLRHLTLDSATGRVLRERDIVRLSSDWFRQGRCEIAAAEAGIVVDLGAALLRLEMDGELLWLRLVQHGETQSEERRFAALQPLIEGGRIYHVSRGGEAVECLELNSGRQRWATELSAPGRLAGVSAGSLVLCGPDSVSALSLDDGRVRWRAANLKLAAMPLVGGEHVLVAESDAVAKASDQYRVRWTWLDSVSGEARQSAVVSEWTLTQPRLGPVVPYPGGLLCFSPAASGAWEWIRFESASAARRLPLRSGRLAGTMDRTSSGDALP
jgi:outer membrane protein assembly factor BamB